jgi:hypothetical protein
MQLRLAHRALEPQQQPIIKLAAIIDPVLVEDERIRQRADLQQPMPVGRVPSETGDLQSHDDADAAESDVGDEALKAVALCGRRAGEAEIFIDDHDLLCGPPEDLRASLEIVLSGRALAILLHLL